MQISKLFLVFCATLGCALIGQAADHATAPLVAPRPSPQEAIEKAREAVRQKVGELEGQPVPAAVQAPAPAPAAPEPKPVTAPAAAPVVISAQQDDSEAVQKAREAVHQKMQELNGGSAPATAPQKVKTPAPKKVKAPAPERASALPPATQFAPAATQTDEATLAKAREALRQKMSELKTTAPSAAPVAATPKAAARQKGEFAPVSAEQTQTRAVPAALQEANAKELQKQAAAEAEAKRQAEKAMAQAESAKPKKVKAEAVSPATAKLEGPPLPISATKQQRLAELLNKYKADQLTAEQYHEQRAKILAEP